MTLSQITNNWHQLHTMYISCDQASNSYNCEGKNAPIVAKLTRVQYANAITYEMNWMTPFELNPNVQTLKFRALMLTAQWQPTTPPLDPSEQWILDPVNTFYD